MGKFFIGREKTLKLASLYEGDFASDSYREELCNFMVSFVGVSANLVNKYLDAVDKLLTETGECCSESISKFMNIDLELSNVLFHSEMRFMSFVEDIYYSIPNEIEVFGD